MTGGALANDLTQRGLQVTLVERAQVTAGTTGRSHGVLHSGARYAVKDQESAIRCIKENTILRRIAPGLLELNGGLFVAITDEDIVYKDAFLEGCAQSGIPTRDLTREEALRLEPNLTSNVKLAVQVPDGTMDLLRLTLRYMAAAKYNSADIKTYTEVIALKQNRSTVTGVQVHDYVTGEEYEIGADITVNATGPWSDRIAAMAGISIPIQPSPGVLVAFKGRICNMVINRMHNSSDGDIILPQRALSIVGTTSWITDDPDDIPAPEEHIQMMLDKGSEMIPLIRQLPLRAAWSAVRPLIKGKDASTGRELSRAFKCLDHLDEGVEGFVSIIGGKAVTARKMAEITSDKVCKKLGVDIPCHTHEVTLLPHTAYYV